MNWSRENNMLLHEKKFELMLHKCRENLLLTELPFTSHLQTYSVSTGDTLDAVTHLRDLGVIVSDDLSWSTHISSIVPKARSVAAWIFSVFITRDTISMMTLYKSLVRSLLEYSCPLWNPKKVSDIHQLEAVQRTFTKKIWNLRDLDYWKRLKVLNLMSLQRRRERYIILHMWKVLHCITPNDLKIEFRPPNRLGIKAKVPQTMHGAARRHQTIYDASFAIQGPRLWNCLPSNVTTVSSFDQFKELLTTFLLSFPDTPPVRGYTCVNSNSLLEWSLTNSDSRSPHAMSW